MIFFFVTMSQKRFVKTAIERQRDCRQRKKQHGHYVSIFVPNGIYENIKGKPSLLLLGLMKNEELIEVIANLEKEKIVLELRLNELMESVQKMKKELLKVYSNKKLCSLVDIKPENHYELIAQEKIEKYFALPTSLHEYRRKVFQLKAQAAKIIESLNGELNYFKVQIERIRDCVKDLIQNIKEGQDAIGIRRVIVELREVKNTCWVLLDRVRRFESETGAEHRDLKKRLNAYDL